MPVLKLVRCGRSPRLDRVLGLALAGRAVEETPFPAPGELVLFVLCVDRLGPDESFVRLLRRLRADPLCMEGCTAGVIVDGATELDTKDMARQLILTANASGCAFPARPLVEATGSLQNLAVQRKRYALPTLEDAYLRAVGELLDRLQAPMPGLSPRPRLLMLHASERATSNTLALGEAVCSRLQDRLELRTLSLRNGTIEDCRGCGYKVCAHFASKGACFYGGSIAQEVLPAVQECELLLLLAPNYNDAPGANIMAFINRLTSLHVSNALAGQRLYAIVCSGYSGGDIVARQLLGGLCLNKSFLLPPRFSLLVTANDPGQAMTQPDIQARLDRFAAGILPAGQAL